MADYYDSLLSEDMASEEEEENVVEWNWGKKQVVINHPWGKTQETYDFDISKVDKIFDYLFEKG